MQLNDKRTINGWAYFDWANSAYYLVISTAIFPIYFSSVTNENISIFGGTISNTALYSFSVSAAYILIAFLSPLLSGIADYTGRRMYFLK
ncbi:MAG TPA: MFS transporter, partial [Saprospiraceae bacterium]|nr:MFS transporter [Saprospiraceae bacterium]